MREEPAAKIHAVRSGMAQVAHVANPVVASVGVIECIPQAEPALAKASNKPQLTRIRHAESRPITFAVIRRLSQQKSLRQTERYVIRY